MVILTCIDYSVSSSLSKYSHRRCYSYNVGPDLGCCRACHTAANNSVENHRRSLRTKETFLSTFPIVPHINPQLSLSVITNERGGKRIPGLYRIYEDSHTLPARSGKMRGGGIGMLCASPEAFPLDGILENSLCIIYLNSLFHLRWIQASKTRILRISRFLLDFTFVLFDTHFLFATGHS